MLDGRLKRLDRVAELAALDVGLRTCERIKSIRQRFVRRSSRSANATGGRHRSRGRRSSQAVQHFSTKRRVIIGLRDGNLGHAKLMRQENVAVFPVTFESHSNSAKSRLIFAGRAIGLSIGLL